MTQVTKFVLCVILLVMAASAFCQDCKTPGQQCADDENCCGGCCRNNVCIQTTDICYEDNSDPCLKHECPPGLACYIYQPDCTGCEPKPQCGSFIL